MVLFLRWFQCSLAYIAPRFNTFLLPCCCQGVVSGEPPTHWSANGGVPVRWYSKAKIPTERAAKRLEKWVQNGCASWKFKSSIPFFSPLLASFFPPFPLTSHLYRSPSLPSSFLISHSSSLFNLVTPWKCLIKHIQYSFYSGLSPNTLGRQLVYISSADWVLVLTGSRCLFPTQRRSFLGCTRCCWSTKMGLLTQFNTGKGNSITCSQHHFHNVTQCNVM